MDKSNFLEIERKYLIKNLPSDLEDYPFKEISQTYLSQPGVPPTIRVRQWGDSFCMTVKSHQEDSIACHEVEFEIKKEYYDQLCLMSPHRLIQKRRYFIPWQEREIELDIFKGKLEGLILAEIEFESLKASESSPTPSWFGEEVTQDFRYSNNTLSSKGIPH